MQTPERGGPKYCSQYKIQDLFLVHAFLHTEHTRSCFYDLPSIWRNITKHKTTSQPVRSQNIRRALYLLTSLFAKDKKFPTDIELHITEV